MYVKCIYCKIRFVIEQHTNNCHNIRLKIFFPLLVYLNMNGVKSEWPTITAVTAFFWMETLCSSSGMHL